MTTRQREHRARAVAEREVATRTALKARRMPRRLNLRGQPLHSDPLEEEPSLGDRGARVGRNVIVEGGGAVAHKVRQRVGEDVEAGVQLPDESLAHRDGAHACAAIHFTSRTPAIKSG